MPAPPPKNLPATMCFIDGCPYRRHSTRLGMPICQQHERMLDKHNRLDLKLQLERDEIKYSRDGYPLPD
jgi:hypothetical protein